MTPRALLAAHLRSLGYIGVRESCGAVVTLRYRVTFGAHGPEVEGPEPLRLAVAAWWDGLSDEGRAAAVEAGA